MPTPSRRKSAASTVADILAPAPATPIPADAASLEQHILALVAQLVETESQVASLHAMIEATPVGARLAGLRKEVDALKERLRADMLPLQLSQDKPLNTAYGTVGWTKRVTKVLAAIAVRELAPQVAPLVITETVDNKALAEVLKLCIKRNELPADTLQRIEDHVMSEEKVGWAFVCQLLGSKKA